MRRKVSLFSATFECDGLEKRITDTDHHASRCYLDNLERRNLITTFATNGENVHEIERRICDLLGPACCHMLSTGVTHAVAKTFSVETSLQRPNLEEGILIARAFHVYHEIDEQIVQPLFLKSYRVGYEFGSVLMDSNYRRAPIFDLADL